MGRARFGAVLAALAANVTLLFVAVLPAGASAASFVQGEDLPSCSGPEQAGREWDRVLLSRDGSTAAWEECVYTKPEGLWAVQSVLPVTPPESISDDGETLLDRGRVFQRSGETWTEQPRPPYFSAVSGDGNTAVEVSETGKVVVYSRSGETWTEESEFTQELECPKKRCWAYPLFGAERNVELSSNGETLVVGAQGIDDNVGAAYVFGRSGGVWKLQGKLTGVGEKGKGQFGQAVAISADGNTVLVGAILNKGAHGGAWVFARSGETWTQQAMLSAPKVKGSDAGFGQSVALSADGDTALVGAGGEVAEKKRRTEKAGYAFAFERAGGSWSESQTLTPAGGQLIGDEFGENVALSGDGDTAFISEETLAHFVTEEKTFMTVWTR